MFLFKLSINKNKFVVLLLTLLSSFSYTVLKSQDCVGSNTNVLINHSFESPARPSIGNNLDGFVNIPGWTIGVSTFNQIRTNGSNYSGGPNNAHNGVQYIDVTSAAGFVSQIFSISCTSTLNFGGRFSSREAGYTNWTAVIKITTITGSVVGTSASRNFTGADADANPPDATWYLLTGTTTSIPAGRYIIVVDLGDYGNFDNAFVCTTCGKILDADSDGLDNNSDLDDDNDGITDLQENSAFLPYNDTDNDGIPNYTDTTPGGSNPAFVDSNGDGINDAYDKDRDGIINSEDLDSDNDGINDLTESGNAAANTADTNSDGTISAAESAPGADGIPLAAQTTEGTNPPTPRDTDGDGLPDFRDLDSDNDGINDLDESYHPGVIDANSDGVVDGPDSDGDGIRDSVDNNDTTFGDPDTADSPRDTDGDGIPNYRDLDSDNDGINDLTEAANSGIIDANSDGVVDGSDADLDGIRDSADNNDSTYGDPDTADSAKDTDGDAKPDYMDLDSDNDGINDLTESGNTGLTDVNSDGVVDGPDADSDGIRDSADNNDATFGDPDTGDTPLDTDGDGIANYIDLDSDNDSVNDINESGNVGVLDTNNDGLVDGWDADGDGIFDSADNNDTVYGDPDTGDTPIDTDGTGGPNYLDLDSDNNGTSDLVQSGNVGVLDANSDGIVDGGDADGDGIRDSADDNDAYFGESSTPLPITLINFNGIKENKTNKLFWKTASERNNDYYSILRSENGIDFIELGQVKSENKSNGFSYQFLDSNPIQGINYYLLKSVDFDKSLFKSPIIAIDFEDIEKNYLIFILNDMLTVQSIKNNKISAITIFNSNGQIVRKKTDTDLKNFIDVSDLANGFYLILINSSETSYYKKIIIR
jgi:hypothetical protein